MSFQLSRLADEETVTNVVVFISDSLRDDYLPDSIANLGVRMHAVAPSTFTASSMPSILTGKFPTEHKVWDFSSQLPEKPYLLDTANSGGVNVDNVWGNGYTNENKPTLSLLRLEQNTQFDELNPPFVYIVHDHGGHSPYGEQDGRFKNSREFFERHVGDREGILDKYEQGVARSAERFMDLYEHLRDEALLEETLVVFTSDHGELLGEYGSLYEHTAPMVPELLKVPVVFCGAGLPHSSVNDELISSADIAPTLLGAQERDVPGEMQGRDLWSGDESERLIRADAWRETRFGDRVSYRASSVWDENGGVVVHRGSGLGRAAFALGTSTYLESYVPMVRQSPIRNIPRILRVHVPNRIEYGQYSASFDPVRLLEAPFERRENREEVEVDREKLRALGYIE